MLRNGTSLQNSGMERPDCRENRCQVSCNIERRHQKNYNYDTSTNTVFNAAYVRMKNLQLGYTIPKITQKANLETIRVYFSGEDLFEFHNTPGGWDPEEGGTYREYPFARNYSVGINLVF